MLTILTELVGIYSNIIKTDFELASINAFRNFFPEARLSGCLFHLGQSVQRKVGNYGLKRLYRTDSIVRRFIRSLSTLSFIREDKVIQTFEELKNNPDFPIECQDLYDYFGQTYIYPGPHNIYSINLWNCNLFIENNYPRTNNAIEGWHKTFKDTFKTSRYSLIILIKMLREKEEEVRIKNMRFLAGERFERANKYVLREERLSFIREIRGEQNFGYDYILELLKQVFY